MRLQNNTALARESTMPVLFRAFFIFIIYSYRETKKDRPKAAKGEYNGSVSQMIHGIGVDVA